MKRAILTASHIAVATMYLGTTTVWTSSRNPGAPGVASTARAQASYAIVYRFFGGPTDGALPEGRLIQGPDGMLYGTTQLGGAVGCGTVFQIAPDGSEFMLLHSFTGAPTDGGNPVGGLIQTPDGLYGTTYEGGSVDRGTVFQMAPDGSGVTLLHSFTGAPTDGADPVGSLIQARDGTLYGTTSRGGSVDRGTVFRMAADVSDFTLLYSFTGAPADGGNPGGVIQGLDDMPYGTTSEGGSVDHGTVFQMAVDGNDFTILHSFIGAPWDGEKPNGGLIQGPDGTLYGTTNTGGRLDRGTIFQMAPDGSDFTILHYFLGGVGADASYPVAGVLRVPDGTLYGMTPFGPGGVVGVVFRLSPGS